MNQGLAFLLIRDGDGDDAAGLEGVVPLPLLTSVHDPGLSGDAARPLDRERGEPGGWGLQITRTALSALGF
jgi:hypothetical protein